MLKKQSRENNVEILKYYNLLNVSDNISKLKYHVHLQNTTANFRDLELFVLMNFKIISIYVFHINVNLTYRYYLKYKSQRTINQSFIVAKRKFH